MRRKPGALVPLERAILVTAMESFARGEPAFHGYGMAKQLRDRGDTRQLAGHGVIYRALDRLESAGLVESQWEDPQAAADERRPPRRLYRLTVAGERLAREPELASNAPARRLNPGTAQR